ncbi:MAG TPA: hypothetical protein VGN14_04600 [Candidatus Elarobacter sp.]
MRRILATFTLAAAYAATVAPAGAAADPLDFLAGRWHCAHTVGDFSGTYVERFERTLRGRWLRQTYEFPATGDQPEARAEYFIGFDPRVSRVVRFGAHDNGMYFAMRTTSLTDTTMVFEYVLPGPGATATWTKHGGREYTIDGPSYPQNGRTVTEHHDCRKA